MGGFGLDETETQIQEYIPLILEKLPSEKPRMIHSVGDPYNVLLLVKLGIDLIVSDFSKKASDLGVY